MTPVFSVQTLARLDPKVHLELLINPIDPLVVPFKALHFASIRVAKTKPPVTMVLRQLQQLIGYLLVRGVRIRLTPLASLANRKDLAGQPDRYATLRHYPPRHLTPAG